jgi:hypothetical protein
MTGAAMEGSPLPYTLLIRIPTSSTTRTQDDGTAVVDVAACLFLLCYFLLLVLVVSLRATAALIRTQAISTRGQMYSVATCSGQVRWER